MLRRTLPPGRRNGLDRRQTDDERPRLVRLCNAGVAGISDGAAGRAPCRGRPGSPAGACPCVAVVAARRRRRAALPSATSQTPGPVSAGGSQHRGTERRQSPASGRRAELGDRRRRRFRVDVDRWATRAARESERDRRLARCRSECPASRVARTTGRASRSRKSSVPLAATPISLRLRRDRAVDVGNTVVQWNADDGAHELRRRRPIAERIHRLRELVRAAMRDRASN